MFICVGLLTAMGNEMANSYWEAMMPYDFDRSTIEKLIRDK